MDCVSDLECLSSTCDYHKCVCPTDEPYNSKVEMCLSTSLIGESCTHTDNCTDSNNGII